MAQTENRSKNNNNTGGQSLNQGISDQGMDSDQSNTNQGRQSNVNDQTNNDQFEGKKGGTTGRSGQGSQQQDEQSSSDNSSKRGMFSDFDDEENM